MDPLMATAEQLTYLIQSHFSRDEARFTTVALQVAAHEAKAGHVQLAQEIRALIDKRQNDDAKIIKFRPDLSDLIFVQQDCQERLTDLIANESLRSRFQRILDEFRHRSKFTEHGLVHRRKLLLCGPPGTGKTLSASILAGELGLPLCTILMDKLVTKFMGETGAKLRQVFDAIAAQHGVFLFDEFDAIGADRAKDNDVGEMRRVLNAFLQLIEKDRSDSIVIAATNNHSLLDDALFRRFDDVITYSLPTFPQISQLIKSRLGMFKPEELPSNLGKVAKGLSHADITVACRDAIKSAILSNQSSVRPSILSSMLVERKRPHKRLVNN
jgi:SpoVK/Ycf46/Vps4 family AAA+-type ATPase